MERMDSSIISIFKSDEAAPEVMQSMKDISSLAGVLSDLGAQNFFQTPSEILRFLRVIQILNEEALGLDSLIDKSETVYYRYRNRFGDLEPPSKKRVEQIMNVLVKNNWVSKQTNRIKMRDVGKRMMDALIRLANDSLAYYMNDDIGRALFQAKRDADISEAYDDNGISGGNKIASMIRNVQEAITLLRERELELLADRNALPQLEVIHNLMAHLEVRLDERYEQFQTVEESLVLTDLMQKGTTVLAEGTNLSLGMISKYLKFTNMQKTPLHTTIHPEQVRVFISQMFDPPVESDIPNAHQLLSFMEQNQYKDEAIDGLWMPVKFAAPISPMVMNEAIEYLETYEPIVEPFIEEIEEVVYSSEEISENGLDQLMNEGNWLLTKSMIDTKVIEDYFLKQEEATLEQLVIEATSDQWSDAINSLTAVSALVSNKKIVVSEEGPFERKNYEKEWEWMNDGDGAVIIKRKYAGERR